MIVNYIKKQKVNRKIIYSMIAFIGISVIIHYIVNSMNIVSDRDGTKVLKDKKIVIDAGHGGSDVGAEREGVREKDINISIAWKLKQMLEEEGAKVIMTREGDEEVSLEKRTQISNHKKADLFISIHQNAIEDNVTRGIETWFEVTKPESWKLAELVQKSIVELTNGEDRGVKFQNSLYVTKNTEAPSILVECGFISSDSERELLKDNNYQDAIARGVVKGIKQYFSE